MDSEKEKTYRIVWSQHAEDAFDNVTSYIALNSAYYSIKAGDEIHKLIDTFYLFPYKYPECFELPTKNHVYRKAVYDGTYKIIYKIAKREIWVLDIFHGKRSPAQLKKLRSVKP